MSDACDFDAALLDRVLAPALIEPRPTAALVLGSGLAPLIEQMQVRHSIPYAQIPGLAAPSVAKHRGKLSIADWAGRRLLLFEGRLHYYEGHSWERVVMSVRIAAHVGVTQMILTNAAGGIHDALPPGTFMAVRDHIEWNRPYCWRQPGPGALGPVRSTPYSQRLLDALAQAAQSQNIPLLQGIYASVTGPSYETKAEIRALKAWGADAVGMSTTREALCGQSLGLEVAAISCITNKGAGLGAGPITHDEVITNAAMQGAQLGYLLKTLISSL